MKSFRRTSLNRTFKFTRNFNLYSVSRKKKNSEHEHIKMQKSNSAMETRELSLSTCT